MGLVLCGQCKCITMRRDPLPPEAPAIMPTPSPLLEAESTLTDRYQTTVPEPIRTALRLGKRDKIHYAIRPNGEVVLTRAAPADGDDPVLGQFLRFLALDLERHPQRLQSVDAGLVQRARSLVAGLRVDLDAPLSADDE